MDIPRYAKTTAVPADAAQEVRTAYATFKSMFDAVSTVKAFSDDDTLQNLNHVFESVEMDINLISPRSLLRFQLTGDVGGALTPVAQYQNGNATAANTMQVTVAALDRSLIFRVERVGNGAAAATAGALEMYNVIEGGRIVFKPTLNNDATVTVERAAGNVIGGVVNANTIAGITAPTISIFRVLQAGTARVQVGAAINLSLTASTTVTVQRGDRIVVGLAAQVTAFTVNDTAIEMMFEIGFSRDSRTVQSVVTAIAAAQRWSALDRGISLDYFGLWNQYFTSITGTDIVALIRLEYQANGGPAGDVTNITGNSFFEFGWWLGDDVRITDRSALAATYRNLHKMLKSFLPYGMMDSEFVKFLSEA
jgi:hypothetical protein